MARYNYNTYLLLFIFSVCNFLELNADNKAVQILNSDKEIIINSQSNFYLTCLGKRPITWTYPNATIDEEYFSKIEVQTAKNPNEQYPYLAKLIIVNASFVDTGYYYCHEIEAEKEAAGRSSKIYIYVRDEVHLSTSTSELQFMSVPQNSEAIIPCRPTSPDVHVKLIDFNGEQVFNRRTGFKIRTNLFPIHCACEFTRKGKIENISFIISVFSTPNSIEKPSISTSSKEVSIGETIILNCTFRIDVDVYAEAIWDVPNTEGLQSGRINVTKLYIDRLHDGLAWSSLTVKNVTLNDAGNYTCTVKDHVKNTNSISTEILVLN